VSPLIGTQGRLFSHIRDACCYLVCVSVSYPFDTTRSFSAEARPLLFRQQHSLSRLRRSLARSACLDVPAGLSHSPLPATRALRIARRRKGPERTSTAPSSAPPILLDRARLVECPRQGDELCSFGVWNADGVCFSGLDVQTTPRRLGEFLKRGQWFSKSSIGGYEKPWCSGNAFPLY
jgi:hypothetical protein